MGSGGGGGGGAAEINGKGLVLEFSERDGLTAEGGQGGGEGRDADGRGARGATVARADDGLGECGWFLDDRDADWGWGWGAAVVGERARAARGTEAVLRRELRRGRWDGQRDHRSVGRGQDEGTDGATVGPVAVEGESLFGLGCDFIVAMGAARIWPLGGVHPSMETPDMECLGAFGVLGARLGGGYRQIT